MCDVRKGEMNKGNQKGIPVHELKNVSVGFRRDDFVLVLNGESEEILERYAVRIPTEYMKEIVTMFQTCGKEYQKFFGTDIGF